MSEAFVSVLRHNCQWCLMGLTLILVGASIKCGHYVGIGALPILSLVFFDISWS